MSHSWTVVHHRVALQPGPLLVQSVERAEALRRLMAVRRSLGRHRRLVKLASIARAARDRDYLIFHISAAHASLGIRQLTIILALTTLMQSVLERH